MADTALGPTGARLLSTLARDNRTIFTVADAQQVLDASYDATKKVLRRLTRAGWLVRLTAGSYAIVPLSSGDEAIPEVDRYVIARELVGEASYYISHESAMDVHHMLTRPVTTVIVTTTRRLVDRKILGVPYRFVYAPPSALWGIEPIWVTPYEQVIVSDIERTVLDGLDRPDLCAGVSQAATGLWIRQEDFSWDKMAEYARRLGRGAAAKRLGYLLELYELGTPSLIDALQEMVTAGYSPLDSLLPAGGPHLARWRLRLNLDPETLHAAVRT